MSVKEVMDSWTLQTGFPVVTVKRNYQEGTALITQVRGNSRTLQTGFPVAQSRETTKREQILSPR
jgi:aminopeptidase N